MATITGTSGGDALNGTSFADLIYGLEGDDFCDAGNRVSQSDSSYDFIDGGAGTDTWVINCFGEASDLYVSMVGSPGILRSNSGNYVVDAYNMEKLRFTGGSGADRIYSGQAGVSIDGGDGVDFWSADLTYVSQNFNFFLGSTQVINPAGLTFIHSIERVEMSAGAGHNRLGGGDYADTLRGGGGFDTMDAGSRVFQTDGYLDVLDGQDGVDLWVVDCSSETQGVALNFTGAPGVLRSTSGAFGVDAYNMEELKFTGSRGDDQLYSGARAIQINGLAGVDYWNSNYSASTANIAYHVGVTDQINVVGLDSVQGIEKAQMATGSGADTLTGGAYADIYQAGEGDDVLNAGSRELEITSDVDFLDGQGGTDTWVVDCGSDTQGVSLVFVGSPATLRSNSNKFHVNAYGMEWVRVIGGGGADRLNTGAGGRSVDGGAGADFWLADYGGATTNIRFFLGTTGAIASVGLELITRVEKIDLTTGSGRDSIIGGAFADVIRTGSGNDQIDARTRESEAGSDFDVIDGGLGTDVWNVDCSSDRQGVAFEFRSSPATLRSVSGKFQVDAYNMELFNFLGGRGFDSIFTGARGGTIDGGGGIDFWSSNFTGVTRRIVYDVETTTKIDPVGLSELKNLERIDMTTGSGGDRISGGDYADSISTGDGDDRIDPRSRALQLDSSYDFADGGNGTDTLVVDAAEATSGVIITASGAPSFFVRTADNSFMIDAYNVEVLEFTGGRFADSATGGAAAELLTGNNGADTLNGGDGQDTIIGGSGEDMLGGGGGRDTFIFASISETTRGNPDRIVDLTAADVIDLSRIDANVHTLANDAFAFVAELTGVAGQATLKYRQGVTTLSMDVDGDARADAVILLDGRHDDHANFLS